MPIRCSSRHCNKSAKKDHTEFDISNYTLRASGLLALLDRALESVLVRSPEGLCSVDLWTGCSAGCGVWGGLQLRPDELGESEIGCAVSNPSFLIMTWGSWAFVVERLSIGLRKENGETDSLLWLPHPWLLYLLGLWNLQKHNMEVFDCQEKSKTTFETPKQQYITALTTAMS